MSESIENASDAIWAQIHWPEGLDERRFLSEYWQKAPLLIPQGLPDFKTPLDADDLAGLSLEPNTTPRLIIEDSGGHYQLEHGPFEEERFESLTGNDWSLLVTDVEKHHSELRPYLAPFSFLPNWRIDDLMISYAPVGASVGAHIDEYDVFLLQASGKRRWSIDSRPERQHKMLADAHLKLLSNFEPTNSWELEPGDILYLPPGIAHHGIASEDPCTTWSIGFRAPAIPDMIMRMAELLCEALPHERYTDPPLSSAVSGEISEDALLRFEKTWQEATRLPSDTVKEMVAQLLTESVSTDREEFVADNTGSQKRLVGPDSFSRIAWYRNASAPPGQVRLFIDGAAYDCSETLATDLSRPARMVMAENSAYSSSDQALLRQLIVDGTLVNLQSD